MSQAKANTTELLLPVLENILEDIATTANSLKSGLISAECNGGDGQAFLYTVASERIGWLADLGLTHITGSPEIVGDAERWFMSPAYQEAKERLEAKGGES